MNTCQDGELTEVYKSGKKKLIPLIYCHGLKCNRTAQSGNCRDFASNGYIVFSLDHFDGTCYYTKKKDGTDKTHTTDHNIFERKDIRA
jgi:hypothetical protein